VNVLGYTRVSTKEQAQKGLSLRAQADAMREACERRGWSLSMIESDEGVSTRRRRRPGLDRAIKSVAAGEYDVLMVSRLDRLARSVGQFASLIAQADKQGWTLVVLEPDFDLTTPYGRMVAHVAAAFAEFERDLISQRTREGLAIARSEGRIKPHVSVVPDSVRRRIALEREAGRTWAAIARGLNRDGITPPGGVPWTRKSAAKHEASRWSSATSQHPRTPSPQTS